MRELRITRQCNGPRAWAVLRRLDVCAIFAAYHRLHSPWPLIGKLLYVSSRRMLSCLTVLFVFLLVAPSACAQPIGSERVTDKELVYLLNRIEVLGEAESRDLSVRVLQASDLPGSAGYESGEVTHTVYVAVSEYDELPEQSLFRLSELLAPAFAGSGQEGEVAFYLSYGALSDRKRVRVVPSLERLDIESVEE